MKRTQAFFKTINSMEHYLKKTFISLYL